MEFYNTKIFSYHISLIRKYDFEHGAKTITFLLTRYVLQHILPHVFSSYCLTFSTICNMFYVSTFRLTRLRCNIIRINRITVECTYIIQYFNDIDL